VTRVLAYETISETDFNLDPQNSFQPNYFVDISKFLEQKMEAIAVYKSELGSFPFPRSPEAIRALAALRGSASGFMSAEAFQLLRERQ
jgi:LmbE family N-acetylglucosaminyl deacetylase